MAVLIISFSSAEYKNKCGETKNPTNVGLDVVN